MLINIDPRRYAEAVAELLDDKYRKMTWGYNLHVKCLYQGDDLHMIEYAINKKGAPKVFIHVYRHGILIVEINKNIFQDGKKLKKYLKCFEKKLKEGKWVLNKKEDDAEAITYTYCSG